MCTCAQKAQRATFRRYCKAKIHHQMRKRKSVQARCKSLALLAMQTNHKDCQISNTGEYFRLLRIAHILIKIVTRKIDSHTKEAHEKWSNAKNIREEEFATML